MERRQVRAGCFLRLLACTCFDELLCVRFCPVPEHLHPTFLSPGGSVQLLFCALARFNGKLDGELDGIREQYKKLVHACAPIQATHPVIVL